MYHDHDRYKYYAYANIYVQMVLLDALFIYIIKYFDCR